MCHSARKVSYVKGTEWGRIGAKRRKRLGAASTYPQNSDPRVWPSFANEKARYALSTGLKYAKKLL